VEEIEITTTRTTRTFELQGGGKGGGFTGGGGGGGSGGGEVTITRFKEFGNNNVNLNILYIFFNSLHN
jgi:hypothetical protein